MEEKKGTIELVMQLQKMYKSVLNLPALYIHLYLPHLAIASELLIPFERVRNPYQHSY